MHSARDIVVSSNFKPAMTDGTNWKFSTYSSVRMPGAAWQHCASRARAGGATWGGRAAALHGGAFGAWSGARSRLCSGTFGRARLLRWLCRRLNDLLRAPPVPTVLTRVYVQRPRCGLCARHCHRIVINQVPEVFASRE